MLVQNATIFPQGNDHGHCLSQKVLAQMLRDAATVTSSPTVH